MKQVKLWMLAVILLSSLSMMELSSCTKDNDDNRNNEYVDYLAWLYDISNIEYLDSGYISYYDILWDIIYDHENLESYDDQLFFLR